MQALPSTDSIAAQLALNERLCQAVYEHGIILAGSAFNLSSAMFSNQEIEYLRSQRLARIATASPDGDSIQPDVAPVGFDFDGEYFYIGGMNLPNPTKYRNVQRNSRVALVIDDLKSTQPWEPRGVRIYGIADVVTREGGYMARTDHPSATYLRIRPTKKWSWGIEGPVFVQGKFNVKRSSG